MDALKNQKPNNVKGCVLYIAIERDWSSRDWLARACLSRPIRPTSVWFARGSQGLLVPEVRSRSREEGWREQAGSSRNELCHVISRSLLEVLSRARDGGFACGIDPQ